MIREVKEQISGPLFIGGGIRTPQQAIDACLAGADIVVVGNAIEKDQDLVGSLVQAIHGLNP